MQALGGAPAKPAYRFCLHSPCVHSLPARHVTGRSCCRACPYRRLCCEHARRLLQEHLVAVEAWWRPRIAVLVVAICNIASTKLQQSRFKALFSCMSMRRTVVAQPGVSHSSHVDWSLKRIHDGAAGVHASGQLHDVHVEYARCIILPLAPPAGIIPEHSQHDQGSSANSCKEVVCVSGQGRLVARAAGKPKLMWEALREATDEEMERDPTVCVIGMSCSAFACTGSAAVCAQACMPAIILRGWHPSSCPKGHLSQQRLC